MEPAHLSSKWTVAPVPAPQQPKIPLPALTAVKKSVDVIPAKARLSFLNSLCASNLTSLDIEKFDKETDFTGDSRTMTLLARVVRVSNCCVKSTNCWFLKLNLICVSSPSLYALKDQLTFSMNKLLASCLKLSKKCVVYTWLNSTIMFSIDFFSFLDHQIIPSIKLLYREPFNFEQVSEESARYCLHFQSLKQTPSGTGKCQILTDFVFLETWCGIDLSWPDMRIELCYETEHGEVYERITISKNNSCLLQKTEQTEIYAVRLHWPFELETVGQVRKYIKTAFRHFSKTPVAFATESFDHCWECISNLRLDCHTVALGDVMMLQLD